LAGIKVNGEWISDPGKVKKEVVEFFARKFEEPCDCRPMLLCEEIRRLERTDAENLVQPFSVEEIKEALWECSGDRAPGPDGLNFSLIRRCWEELETDFIELFNGFFETETINAGCLNAFITLIPKVRDPVLISDFRPITLIGVINKTLSKVLGNRLKKVIGSIVSEEQTTFILGRNILDGPLMLNEVVAMLKKKKRKGMLFKLDIEKAYDSVNWLFLLSILEQMGFPMKWRNWIMAMLKVSKAAVLVNGSPTEEFTCFRGLRQGDPMSPFLFLIVMEAFSCITKKQPQWGFSMGLD
jgi:hypothetical protein